MQDEQRVNEQFDLIRFVSNSLRLLRRTFWLVLSLMTRRTSFGSRSKRMLPSGSVIRCTT